MYHVELDVETKKDFWSQYKFTFDDFYQYIKGKPNVVIKFYDNSKMSIFHMKVTVCDKNAIHLHNQENCFDLQLISNEGLQLYVESIYGNCEVNFAPEFVTNDVSVTSRILNVIERIGKFFNVTRFFLIDAAVNQILYKRGIDIDFTTLSVFRDNLLFYEKYGYSICDFRNVNTQLYPCGLMNIDIQKKLLRDFPYAVWKHLLNKSDRAFIKTLDITGNYHFDKLHEAFTFYFAMLDKKSRIPELKKFLQIFKNADYPWYSMIYAIQNAKICMEKSENLFCD